MIERPWVGSSETGFSTASRCHLHKECRRRLPTMSTQRDHVNTQKAGMIILLESGLAGALPLILQVFV